MKRFGRNQKRKMREQAEKLQRRLDASNGSLKQAKELLTCMEDDMRYTRHVAARMSILFPADITQKHSAPVDFIEVARIPEINYLSGPETVPKMETFVSDRLPVLISRISKDALKHQIHFRVKFGESELAYCTTIDGVKCMPKEAIADEISRQFSVEIMKKFG